MISVSMGRASSRIFLGLSMLAALCLPGAAFAEDRTEMRCPQPPAPGTSAGLAYRIAASTGEHMWRQISDGTLDKTSMMEPKTGEQLLDLLCSLASAGNKMVANWRQWGITPDFYLSATPAMLVRQARASGDLAEMMRAARQSDADLPAALLVDFTLRDACLAGGRLGFEACRQFGAWVREDPPGVGAFEAAYLPKLADWSDLVPVILMLRSRDDAGKDIANALARRMMRMRYDSPERRFAEYTIAQREAELSADNVGKQWAVFTVGNTVLQGYEDRLSKNPRDANALRMIRLLATYLAQEAPGVIQRTRYIGRKFSQGLYIAILAEHGDHDLARLYLSNGTAWPFQTDADVQRYSRIARMMADAGDPTGMWALGHVYYDGIVGKPDQAAGLRWFEKAAEAGDLSSVWVLYKYNFEKGSNHQAYLYLARAAALGDKVAQGALPNWQAKGWDKSGFQKFMTDVGDVASAYVQERASAVEQLQARDQDLARRMSDTPAGRSFDAEVRARLANAQSLALSDTGTDPVSTGSGSAGLSNRNPCVPSLGCGITVKDVSAENAAFRAKLKADADAAAARDRENSRRAAALRAKRAAEVAAEDAKDKAAADKHKAACNREAPCATQQ